MANQNEAKKTETFKMLEERARFLLESWERWAKTNNQYKNTSGDNESRHTLEELASIVTILKEL